MSLQCPRCHSPKVASFHHAMKTGAAIGAVGGLARGISAALAGGKAGAALGAIAGPVGITLGSASGAILGGLVGGVGGCALGASWSAETHHFQPFPPPWPVHAAHPAWLAFFNFQETLHTQRSGNHPARTRTDFHR